MSQVRHLPDAASESGEPQPDPGCRRPVGKVKSNARRADDADSPRSSRRAGRVTHVAVVGPARHDDRPDCRYAHPDPQRRPDRAAAGRYAQLRSSAAGSPRFSRTRAISGISRSSKPFRPRPCGSRKYGPNGERLITRIDRVSKRAGASTTATRTSKPILGGMGDPPDRHARGVLSDRLPCRQGRRRALALILRREGKRVPCPVLDGSRYPCRPV